MKTFLDPVYRQEILTRIHKLTPQNRRRWGKMDVHQMVCHLADSTRVILGEKKVRFLGNAFTRSSLYRKMAFSPLPWPRGILKTAPEIDQIADGTKPTTFEADKKELIRLLEEFSARTGQTQWPEHALFGECSREDWAKQIYRHCDHHLTQFSA
jgi:hypothetical protein